MSLLGQGGLTAEKKRPYICDFCGKEYSNGKALGGHRRSHLQKLKKTKIQTSNSNLYNRDVIHPHPETQRDWRAIHPQQLPMPMPMPMPRNSCSSSVDLSKSLIGWTIKGKRGPKGMKEQAASNGAHVLMVLAGGASPSNLNLDLMDRAKGSVENSISKYAVPLKKRRRFNNTSQQDRDNNNINGGNIIPPEKMDSALVALVNAVDRQISLSPQPQPQGPHICNLTPGAQYMSCAPHSRGKKSHSSRSVSAGVHQCPKCGKVLSTGQALGGHKRHCKGPADELIIEAQPIYIFPFDLNKPAPADSQEAMEAQEVMSLTWHEDVLACAEDTLKETMEPTRGSGLGGLVQLAWLGLAELKEAVGPAGVN
ncbi:hypothetical protein F0562_001691 [Nyssa sinensis]|uniref:C2H2-type domain-containing protein n=1 Tax=Nyssa sinensis TaxID=561372 RepID=A0A5J5C7W0_9ASTE|nr:hypothetical protein F0562_001691 [Nyssa sinensis]